jgi:hypothetical protein
MEYRGVEYEIRQGVERNVWKWSVSFKDGLTKSGQAVSRRRAITIIWRLIDEVLGSRKQRLATNDGEKQKARRIPVPHEIQTPQQELAAFNARIAELENEGHRGHALEVLEANALDFARQIDELRSLPIDPAPKASKTKLQRLSKVYPRIDSGRKIRNHQTRRPSLAIRAIVAGSFELWT